MAALDDVLAPDDWVDVLAALGRGGLVVVPTDTVYGVGGLVSHAGAVDTLFRLKGRDRTKPIAVLVADADQASEIAVFGPVSRRLAERFWPGGLTLVVPRANGFDARLGGERSTVGIRCPHHDGLRNLLARSGPLAVTSANLAGRPTPSTAAEIAEVFGAQVDAVVDGGTLAGLASTVVDCCGSVPEVLREGPVSREHLRAAVQDLL